MFPRLTFVAITPIGDVPPRFGNSGASNQRLEAVYGLRFQKYVGALGQLLIPQGSEINAEDFVQALEQGEILLGTSGQVCFGTSDDKKIAAQISFDPAIGKGSILVNEINFEHIYFSFVDSVICWGTDPGVIATMSIGHPPALDDSYILNFLKFGPYLTTHTPFKGVYQVPFGSSVHFSSNGFKFHPRYELFSHPSLAIERSNGEWEEECINVLRNAILDYIGNANQIGLMVSGGLDSSLLWCMVDTQLSQTVEWTPVHLYYPNSITANEKVFIDTLLDNKRESIVIDMDQALCLDGSPMPNWIALYPEPHREFLTSGMWLDLYQSLVGCDIHKILTGFGGDQLFLGQAGSPLHLLHLKYIAGMREWFDELYRWSVARRITIWETLWVLSRDLSSLIPGLTRRHLRQRLELPSLEDRHLESWVIPLLEQANTLRHWQTFTFIHSSSSVDKALYLPQIDIIYPYVNREVMGFSLGVPLDQHLGLGWDRYLERRVAQRLGVPSRIAWRDSKGGIIEPIIRSCRKHHTTLESFIKNARLVEMKFVSSEYAQELLVYTLAGKQVLADRFLNFYMLENWLRSRPEFS